MKRAGYWLVCAFKVAGSFIASSASACVKPFPLGNLKRFSEEVRME